MLKNFRRIILILILVLLLPIFIFMQNQVVSFLSRAQVKKADLVIDTLTFEGQLSGNWLNFAQGGEEPPPMLNLASSRMKLLQPKYIRLDHIFDYYDVVKDDGSFDFSKLDATVENILNMGAKPFFSLSYMPRQFSRVQSVIEKPDTWSDWQLLVQRTIEHYSGRNNKNLTYVYYEVWNEPDLPQFGGFKLTGNKNYLELYKYSSNGANTASNVNKFFFGGPAVGSFYHNWVNDFVSYAEKNNLRLDFYSWHRYHQDPEKFSEDAKKIRKLLGKFPKFANLPLVLSEWGIDSENNKNSSNEKGAAHALATVFNINSLINLPFAFEIKDGPPPQGGQWGLMTHEKDKTPLFLKPRFKAFAASTFLTGNKLKVSGQGSFVTALAVKSNDDSIYVLVNNYDVSEKNWENVPLTVTGLTPGTYKIQKRQILTNTSSLAEIVSTDGLIKQQLLMLPNSIYLLEIKKSGNIAQLTSGVTNSATDYALVLTDNNDFKLEPFSFDLGVDNELRFDIKPFWTGGELNEVEILRFSLIRENSATIEVTLSKVKSNYIDFLLLQATDDKNSQSLAIPVINFKEGDWHKIRIGIAKDKMFIALDKTANERESQIYNSAIKISGINFYPLNGAIDNLEIIKEGTVFFTRDFN